jgi:hypothetical protein
MAPPLNKNTITNPNLQIPKNEYGTNKQTDTIIHNNIDNSNKLLNNQSADNKPIKCSKTTDELKLLNDKHDYIKNNQTNKNDEKQESENFINKKSNITLDQFKIKVNKFLPYDSSIAIYPFIVQNFGFSFANIIFGLMAVKTADPQYNEQIRSEYSHPKLTKNLTINQKLELFAVCEKACEYFSKTDNIYGLYMIDVNKLIYCSPYETHSGGSICQKAAFFKHFFDGNNIKNATQWIKQLNFIYKKYYNSIISKLPREHFMASKEKFEEIRITMELKLDVKKIFADNVNRDRLIVVHNEFLRYSSIVGASMDEAAKSFKQHIKDEGGLHSYLAKSYPAVFGHASLSND